jgi:hypothetical protein
MFQFAQVITTDSAILIKLVDTGRICGQMKRRVTQQTRSNGALESRHRAVALLL